MKKKVAALLLCVAMVLTLVPALPVRAEGGNALSVNCGGEPVSQLTLPQSEKKELTAVSQESGSARYQWQILANQTLWVDIAGANGSTLDLSYAMVASLLSDDSVQIRATATSAGETATSEPVTVTVTYPAPQPENATPAQTSVTAAALQTSDSTVAPLAVGKATATYEVVINYVFEDGVHVSEPYIARLAAGSNFNTTVTFPTVQGYLPYLDEVQQDSIDLNITNIQKDVIYTVTYKPTNVNYTVIHYWQNLNDDRYTEKERETKQGLTNSHVSEVEKSYEGFYALQYEEPTIAAEGSTVVEVYYDRYYYLMNFDLRGGYGVEPIYARYGAPIGDVGTPIKAGYRFQGWSDGGINIVSLPEEMPAGNRTYRAIWGNAETVNYTVVYWKENANDNNYSFWGQVTKTAVAGTTVSGTYDIPSVITTTKVNGSDLDEKQYFTYNDARTNKNVLVKGDGTTVVNVYYDRNTYHLCFYGIPSTCKIEEHTHSESCDSPCTKLVHPHNYNCYQIISTNVIHVISAKYEQNIAELWPTADQFLNYTLYGWNIEGINNKTAVSKLVSMTYDLCDTVDNLKYAEAVSGGSKQYLYYMFESFDQTSAENGDQRRLLNGTYYDSDRRYYQQVNSTTNNWLQKTIEGMAPVQNGVIGADPNAYTGLYTKVFLYYTRNRYNLIFNNPGDGDVKTVRSIMYEQPLVNYKDAEGKLIRNFVPPYPSNLEPNAFVFEGWYTTPECYPGTEYNFDGATMPNGNLSLYACWKPVTHKVEFYLDQDALDAGTKLLSHPDITVPHGSKVATVPGTPTNGSYTFVGWFYMDGGVEKAFDFANMPVNKDMKVYGKWSSNVLKEYFIYYRIQGTEIDIADPVTGSALAGVTKTFEAKGGTDLYTDYQEGYFPLTRSHSLTLDIEDDANNVYTFWYVQKTVPYTVKYLNKETGVAVAPEKTVSDNRQAVVTETFVPVSGMLPDAYQKRLVVSAEEGAVNEIIFYYTQDTTHAYYKITHYTENLEKDSEGNPTWTEYASSQAIGDIGTTYTADPMTIPGFTYDSTVEGTLTSGELTANGLELKLYYTRNAYPYQVRYLEQVTGKELATPKSGTGKYGQEISESAIGIPNYTAVDPTSQTLNIRIEEGTEAELNIITFYYTENEAIINYVVVGPTGCGTVSPTSETLKVLSGTAQGSTATANENFRFIDWYKDADCTIPVTPDWEYPKAMLTPVKAENEVWTDATYYAKFEYDLPDLTIVTTGTQPIDENQSFIFHVVGDPDDQRTKDINLTVVINGDGSKTIKDLPIGAYTVTEDGNWSWRYEATPDHPNGQITLSATQKNEVIFSNARASAPTTENPTGSGVWKWLNGDAYCIERHSWLPGIWQPPIIGPIF